MGRARTLLLSLGVVLVALLCVQRSTVEAKSGGRSFSSYRSSSSSYRSSRSSSSYSSYRSYRSRSSRSRSRFDIDVDIGYSSYRSYSYVHIYRYSYNDYNTGNVDKSQNCAWVESSTCTIGDKPSSRDGYKHDCNTVIQTTMAGVCQCGGKQGVMIYHECGAPQDTCIRMCANTAMMTVTGDTKAKAMFFYEKVIAAPISTTSLSTTSTSPVCPTTDNIVTTEVCQKAYAEHQYDQGVVGTSPNEVITSGSDANMPPGCSWSSQSGLFLNTNPTATGAQYSGGTTFCAARVYDINDNAGTSTPVHFALSVFLLLAVLCLQ